jgi:hypothetical protein
MGLIGATLATAPWFFAYAGGLRWFNDRARIAPTSSELFSAQSFGVYGLCGFPAFAIGGASVFIWAFNRCYPRRTRSGKR